MRTPISDFLSAYSARGTIRMHMPGHKGHPLTGCEDRDITEISGADVLYAPTGIIRESECNAARLFGTRRTLYSAEGSSLSIKAMLALTVMHARDRGERPLILAARNVHRSFIGAAALLDLDVEWIYGDSLISCRITEETLRTAIASCTRKPTALYLTSPDYLGNIGDIGTVSRVCRESGMLLLVDNAHGAYLRFMPRDMHPISLGADACCDSAHKTLPALTGAAYLHISEHAPEIFSERADEAMALFASTSPSYIILESLDRTNAYLAQGYKERLAEFCLKAEAAKRELYARGFTPVGDEALKITLKTKDYGYTGTDIAEKLERDGIVAEFADPDFLVLMLSPEFDTDVLMRAVTSLISLPRRAPITDVPPPLPRAVRVMSAREAVFAPSEESDAVLCEGRILSSAAVSCPPAIPICTSGELITKEIIECFKYYGTERIRVVR